MVAARSWPSTGHRGHCWSTTLDSHPAAIITQSATVNGKVVYVGTSSEEAFAALIDGYPCCSFRGQMAALDLDTGAILWQTVMTPVGFPGNAVGSSPAVDAKRDSSTSRPGTTMTHRRRRSPASLPQPVIRRISRRAFRPTTTSTRCSRLGHEAPALIRGQRGGRLRRVDGRTASRSSARGPIVLSRLGLTSTSGRHPHCSPSRTHASYESTSWRRPEERPVLDAQPDTGRSAG